MNHLLVECSFRQQIWKQDYDSLSCVDICEVEYLEFFVQEWISSQGFTPSK